MRRVWLAAAVILAMAVAAGAQEKFTYTDLVKRLTDLERLSVLPAAGDTCSQWSSYDRGSKYDAATGKYVGWDANGDGGGIIRQEGDVSVFAEMEGPGVIWRIWSARAQAGHVKIYLDGAAEPVVDLPFSGYFDGKNPPFVFPTLVHLTTNGVNNYVPIPYQKSCKIVADKGWGNYYHFVYETFPKGTVVPTFKRELTADENAALKAADEILSIKLGEDPKGKRDGEAVIAKNTTVAGGKSVTVAQVSGPRAITAIRVKMPAAASRDDEIAALRELAIRITWDGEAKPAVWTPLGDFFGTTPGINKYKSFPLGMTDDGFYAFWYMPFAKGAVVEIVNDGTAERALEISVTHAPLTRPIGELGRFHAKWHRDAFMPAEAERLKIDWTMLKVQGRGRYCGVMLHVWNPRGGWWGEGDEKFFVDGEKFPSTIGTGSEDYFGYAWSDPKLFQNAYHNQTISQGNKGHISVNRWHIADDVPFQTSFEAAIEKYYPNAKPTLYACTTFWYLAPGGTDAYEPQPLTERTGYWTVSAPPVVKGAIQGESMEVLAKTGGETKEQDMTNWQGQWSGEAQLWWTGAKVGDKLDLNLPVATAGKQKVIVYLTKAKDYGIVQLSLDGAKLGQPIDLYNPDVVPTGPIDLGTLDLTAGKHKLTFEITGANEKAVKAYMVGLDYVKLEPAKE